MAYKGFTDKHKITALINALGVSNQIFNIKEDVLVKQYQIKRYTNIISINIVLFVQNGN